MLKLLQKLYTMGFRLISHEVNSAVNLIIHHICLVIICCDILDQKQFSGHTVVDVFDYQIDPQIGIAFDDYYSYCEVLLMKDNVWSFLDDSNVL